MAIINTECEIRYKLELHANLRKNYPIPTGLLHEKTVYIIYGIKIIDSDGEIISNKTSHKGLRSFLHDRKVLQSIDFDLLN